MGDHDGPKRDGQLEESSYCLGLNINLYIRYIHEGFLSGHRVCFNTESWPSDLDHLGYLDLGNLQMMVKINKMDQNCRW